MYPYKTIACLAAVVAALGFAACGGDDDTTTTETAATTATATGTTGATGETTATGETGATGKAATTTLKVEADPSGALAYTETSLSVPAGNVKVEFDNPAPVQHDVAFNDPSGSEVGRTDVITESSTSTELKDLKPGEYRFYCTVPGHEAAGMEGTLTVK